MYYISIYIKTHYKNIILHPSTTFLSKETKYYPTVFTNVGRSFNVEIIFVNSHVCVDYSVLIHIEGIGNSPRKTKITVCLARVL